MRRLFIGILSVVLLLAFLNLYTVEVPSVNGHEGAVAYTQPALGASFIDSGSSTGIAGTVPSTFTKATAALTAEPLKYSAPAPVRKSLFEALLPGCTLCNPTTPPTLPSPSPSPGVTCTSGPVSVVDITADTYAKVSVLEPGGTQTDFTTPTVTTTVSRTSGTTKCSDGSASTGWIFVGSIDYEVGTYYFSKGWGTYAFSVEIYRVVDGDAPDEKLGSLSLAVDATAAR